MTGMSKATVRLFFVTALLLFLSPGALAADGNDDSLLGLWGAERAFLPTQPIRLVVHENHGKLLASALGETVDVVRDGTALSAIFPGDLGSFRGNLNKDDQQIAGHWISEPSVIAYSPIAIPMTLTAKSAGFWEGRVSPIPQTFSIYIAIQRNEQQELKAFMRNPERNQGVFTRMESVAIEGNDVSFLNADGEVVLQGLYDNENQTLTVFMPWRGGSYDLTRRDRDNAPGFYPRTESSYSYQSPIQLHDGWTVADAKEVNVDSKMLEAFVQHIVEMQPDSIRTPYIQSLLVARKGKLILDEYFFGFNPDRVHDMRSASKSLTGIMMGIAINEVDSLNTETTLAEIFPPANEAQQKRSKLTVDHLLSMRSGFDCDDNNSDTAGNEDRMQEQDTQPDWWQYTLALPMTSEPGDSAAYCSGGINLAGGVIATATNTWLPAFFDDRLAKPLQIDNYYMNLDPLKRGYAGGGIQMRPRDFLKFAQLVANQGQWQGKQILSKDWVSNMLASHASIYSEDDYGYTWWRSKLPYKDRELQVFSATGNGGQFLIIVPELDLVVGINGGNYGDFRTWIAWRDQLLPEYLLPALKD